MNYTDGFGRRHSKATVYSIEEPDGSVLLHVRTRTKTTRQSVVNHIVSAQLMNIGQADALIGAAVSGSIRAMREVRE